MSLKTLTVASTLLGISASNVGAQDFKQEVFPIGKVSETVPYTLGKVVAGVNFVLLEKDCYINANGTDTVVHCRKEDSMISFMIENTIPPTSKYIPSLLTIQGDTATDTLKTLFAYPHIVGGILNTIPPYDFSLYSNKTRVCQEINNPSANSTIGGVFVDINSDGHYDAIGTGKCFGVEQGEAKVNLDKVIVPGYSITLPQVSYDCADFGSVYSCRPGVTFPFETTSTNTGIDIIQIDDSGDSEPNVPRLDISYTFITPPDKSL